MTSPAPGALSPATADVVALTRALVSTRSINPSLEPGGEGEGAIAALTAGWLESWGFAVRRVDAAPGRTSVLARLRRGTGPTLILNGHLDTVGVAGMTVDPFGAEVRDGRIWGRGACDMKGGVAAILATAREVAGSDLLGGELVVALTADEEEAGSGGRRLMAEGLRGDGAIVCEPTGLAIMPAHKGFEWIRLDFRGRAAHGSRPDRGIDAIRHAGLLLARLDAMEAALRAGGSHPLLGHGSVHAGTIRGGTAPSVYPDACSLTLERRTLPAEAAGVFRSEVDRELAALYAEVPELDVRSEVLLERAGSEVPGDHPLVVAMAGALEAVGVEPRVEGMTAWVEAVAFNQAGVPALCFGPGRIEDAHSADESIDIEELRTAHAALIELVRSMPW